MPEFWFRAYYHELDFVLAEPALFADLEREFGAERFARRSLRAGFGDWPTTVLLLVGALAAAVVTTTRRQVG